MIPRSNNNAIKTPSKPAKSVITKSLFSVTSFHPKSMLKNLCLYQIKDYLLCKIK